MKDLERLELYDLDINPDYNGELRPSNNSFDSDCGQCEWFLDHCLDEEDHQQVCPVAVERYKKQLICVCIGTDNPEFKK